MLSINLMSTGGEDYYLSLAAEDYYLSGGEPPGKWVGEGAHAFGLEGIVHPQDFRALFRGYKPENPGDDKESAFATPLVQNAGSRNRQPGWDLTFSAPKSVSIIWSQAPEHLRKLIEEALQEAVEFTLGFLEDNFAFSRTGKGGQAEAVRVKLFIPTFQHGTSRAGEPQLHVHAPILNVGLAEDGKTRSILSRPIYRQKMLLGAICRARLAQTLEAKAGFRAERKGNCFDIKGVSQEIVDVHSTRRKEILADLAERGLTSAAAAAKSALNTRRTKEAVRPRAELFEEWQKLNKSHGFTTSSLNDLVHITPRDNATLIPDVLKAALTNVTKRQAHFTQQDFLKEALYEAPVYGVGPDLLIKSAKSFLESGAEVVRIPTTDGSERFTTNSVLKREVSILNSLSSLSQRKGPKVKKATLKRILQVMPCNSEQETAVRHLTLGTGSVRCIRGLPGTGKTSRVLQASIAAWRREGYQVIGAAPSATAAKQLQEDTGIKCDTLHMRLADFGPKSGFNLKFHAKHATRQLIRAAAGKKTYPLKTRKAVKLGKKTILIVDEAGMVGTRHSEMLLALAEKGGGTIIFTGDHRQYPPVNDRPAFKSISAKTGFADLTNIQRQRERWAQIASKHFASGQPGLALAMYGEKKMIRIRDDVEKARTQLVAEWAEYGMYSPSTTAAIAYTNQDTEELNRLCQEKRLHAGLLDTSNYASVEDVDKERGVTYRNTVYVGDEVVFRENNTKLGVDNGTRGTVTAINPAGTSMHVELPSGKAVIIPVKKYRHVRLGYAITGHGIQGGTLDYAFVLLAGPGLDNPTANVVATRARLFTRFFTTKSLLDSYLEDVEDSNLARQLSTVPDLTMASDHFKPQDASSDDYAEILKKLLDDWLPHAERDPSKCIIKVDTSHQVKEINQKCHELLRIAMMAKWDEEQRMRIEAQPLTYHGLTFVPGDRVHFSKQIFKKSIQVGDTATVVNVDPTKDFIEVVKDRDKQTVALPIWSDQKELRPEGIERGYAIQHEEFTKLLAPPTTSFNLHTQKPELSEIGAIERPRYEPPAAINHSLASNPHLIQPVDYSVPGFPSLSSPSSSPNLVEQNRIQHNYLQTVAQQHAWQQQIQQAYVQPPLTQIQQQPITQITLKPPGFF